MTLPDDFREFLRLLTGKDVEFLVVGGHAVSFYGYPRFTHDVDVVIVPSEMNARKVLSVLDEFGFGGLGLTAEDFTQDVTIALGRAPHQIDLMTFIKGVDVQEAWARREPGELDGVAVWFIALEDLIQNKTAVGRPEDWADIERLRPLS